MMFTRRNFGLWVLTLVIVATTPKVTRGDFIVIPKPTDAYKSSTSKVPITDPKGTIENSLSDGLETITFSGPMSVSAVGPGIFGWGNPPTVEDSAPVVLFSQFALSRTLTFSNPVTTFGVEMESNNSTNPFTHPTFTLSETFFDGASVVGTISQKLKAPGGAHLFAASTTTSPFTSVTLTSSSGSLGFLVGQVRYAPAVPEPTSVILLFLGFIGALGYHRFRRGSRRGHEEDV